MLSSLLHLMSHYSLRRQRGESIDRLTATIERHLQVLAEWPDLEPVLRATCAELGAQWRQMADSAAQPERQSLLMRLVAPARGCA